ncbi:MAG: haloacid dehalogenase [Candidatus Eremiobacteraeota bacterium]|nr:haloacid dehalogenase [Candidatus Eremiobacteraeota bacterium]
MACKNLEGVAKKISKRFDGLNEARDRILKVQRDIIRASSLSIRATHRGEFERARELLGEARSLFTGNAETLKHYPELYYTGFVQDAQKEYAEASITLALILREPISDPDELGVEYASYLNGMGEAVGELRRYLLDRIRAEDEATGEDIMESMDEIYYVLTSMDYPDAITRGLRRTTDIARSTIEKTRGDLTHNLGQKRLKKSLMHLEEKLASGGMA